MISVCKKPRAFSNETDYEFLPDAGHGRNESQHFKLAFTLIQRFQRLEVLTPK
jgi:hypothetical protein